MNIGLFSGSFDPIHIGHVALANYIVEFSDVDEIWFLVSPQNPLKKDKKISDENVRYEMTKIAVHKHPRLKASNFEFSLPKPSYTIDTLEALSKKYPKYKFSLIIGADNWEVFESWKNPEKIIDNYNLKIYPRLGYEVKQIPENIRNKIDVLDSPVFDISSTFIRESIAAGKNVRFFLPCGIYEYILENNLYK